MKTCLRVLIALETIFLVLPIAWMWAAGMFIVGSLALKHGLSSWLYVMLINGYGLIAALLLARRYETYAIDRIPCWIWFGLVLGVASSVMMMRTESVLMTWQNHGLLEVAKDLYLKGGGVVIYVATCLSAVFWHRRNIAIELN